MEDLKEDVQSASAGGIQVIARAASILRTLESHPDGLSLGQIAKSVQLARSTVQRIVAALAAEDFVIASGPGDVRIGPGLVRIAASVASNTAELIRPHLRALGDEVGETVDLAVLSGGSTVFVDQVPGRHRLVALSAVGERFPLHCTANGKAILACFSAEDADDLIEKSLAEHPDHPIVDRAALLAELDGIRRTHLAVDLEEHGEGISALGTALLDLFGRPIAISIPVPSQRFAEQRDGLAKSLLAFRKRIKGIVAR
ncbi:MAG: putative transcriptional regulatory protein [Hyphomicrobiales bacterium]|nr:putative transcriptional regulatory protein [Hyphomicrobiales bacterium]